MIKILIKNSNIIDPINGISDDVDILIVDGKIVEISKDIIMEDCRTIEAKGLYVVPGFVDMHCHLREPGQEYKETIYTGTRAAAKGGFTSIACMANTNPINDNPAITTSIMKTIDSDSPINVYPIGAITLGLDGKLITEMGMMAQEGCIAFSDDGKGIAKTRMMYNALLYAKQFNKLIISHCEDEFGLSGSMNEGSVCTRLGLKGISRVAEEIMVFREIALAESLDTKVHIAHISTKGSVEIIRNAKARGVKVTCETCPHYIAGTDEMVIGYDTSTKVNPPLRTEGDRLAIIQGIVDGTIDVIATDHAPHHKDDKEVEYELAANGISGFETAFALSYTYLVKAGYIKLKKLIEIMTYAPAKILGIDGGIINVGDKASLTIIDTENEYKIDIKGFISKGKNNPFDGYSVFGDILYTISSGEFAYDKNSVS